MRRSRLLWAAACLWTAAVAGQEPAAKLTLKELLTEATASLTRAIAEADGEVATKEFRKALTKSEEAIRLQPGSFEAHFLMASCLTEVVKRSQTQEQRRTLAFAAREQFQIAMQCQGADWRPNLLGSQLILREMSSLATTPADKALLVGEVRKALEAGLEMATNAPVRARFEGDLASALLMESDLSTDAAQQRTLSGRAMKLLESATNAQGDASPALWFDLMGVTLLKLGKLDNEPSRFQQAIDRLHSCLTKDPGRIAARYNLACAYALVGRPDLGLAHLAVCFDTETGSKFREIARTDPDLASVRNLPEAAQFFAQPGIKMTIPMARPGLSNR